MKFERYESRFKAGELLAEFIENKIKNNIKLQIHSSQFFCYAIPNGGVPVTEGFCSKYKLNYDLLIVRKIKIPYNTEAGFGAVTTDGTVLINNSLLNQLNLSENEVKNSINITKNEIYERIKLYNKESNLEYLYDHNIKKKNIFLFDDGLASGFTMLAAIKMIKKYNPSKIYIAVPTAPLRTIKKIELEVDEVFCPNIKQILWFAVADAYKNWYDIPELEVLKIISNSSYYLPNLKYKNG